MTAYEAMVEILDINETIQKLKEANTDSVPDMLSCKTVDMLTNYRLLLAKEMKRTRLAIFTGDSDEKDLID